MVIKRLMLAVVVICAVLLGATSSHAEDLYVVKAGDYPLAIAKKLNVPLDYVLGFARNKDPRKLQIGTKIPIPQTGDAKIAEEVVVKDNKDYRVTGSLTNLAPAEISSESYAIKDSSMTGISSGKIVGGKKPAETAVATVEKKKESYKREIPVEKTATAVIKEKDTLPARNDDKFVPSLGRTESGMNRFLELNATAGLWQSLNSDTRAKGYYAIPEGLLWFGDQNTKRAQNYGIGLKSHWNEGSNKNDYDWGYTSVSLLGGFWKEVADNKYFLFKPSVGYRMNKNSSENENGITGGVYTEFNTITSPRNMVTLAFDASVFKDDSYAALHVFNEHIMKPDWKLKLGAGVVGHYGKDETLYGFSPVIGVKYKDTVEFRVIGDTSDKGSIGANITIYFNSDNPHNNIFKLKEGGS